MSGADSEHTFDDGVDTSPADGEATVMDDGTVFDDATVLEDGTVFDDTALEDGTVFDDTSIPGDGEAATLADDGTIFDGDETTTVATLQPQAMCRLKF